MRIDRIKLRVVMLEKDVSQTSLANRSGLSRETINGVCAGRSCTDETAAKIAGALDVDLKALTINSEE